LRIALLSSKSLRCGIAAYTLGLEKGLGLCGAVVGHWGSLEPSVFAKIREWRPDVLHVQYERAIMPHDDGLDAGVREVRKSSKTCVVTLHSETSNSVSMAKRIGFDAVLLHRPPSMLDDAVVVSMPCPFYEPEIGKQRLRDKYGLSRDAFVVSTLGFLLPWKMTSEVAEALIPLLRRRPNTVLQVIAGRHFDPSAEAYANGCCRELSRLSASVGGRILHISNYPPDGEVLDRLALSDLGYVFCPFDTSSCSAASSMFVSAGCPLVASDSTHYDHMPPCVVRASKECHLFAEEVIRVSEDLNLLSQMRKGLALEYSETNFVEFARVHLGLYCSLVSARSSR